MPGFTSLAQMREMCGQIVQLVDKKLDVPSVQSRLTPEVLA